MVNPAGLAFHDRIDHIHLQAFGRRASLSALHDEMRMYARTLEARLERQFSGEPRTFPWGVISMDMETTASPPTPETSGTAGS